MRASEQGGEGKTSPAGPGSEGLGRIIDEVKCASCLWQKPILFLRGGWETGLLLCSLRRCRAAGKKKKKKDRDQVWHHTSGVDGRNEGSCCEVPHSIDY